MTELIKKDETALTQNTGVGRGFERVDMETVSMPTAKLLQSNSPEVSDDDYDFRAGYIIHSLLMEKLPETFIPLSISNSNILFVPRNDADKAAFKAKFNLSDDDINNNNVICRARDGKVGDTYGNCAACGLNKFQGNEKPWCTGTINVLAVFEGCELPVVIQFANTSFKHGRKFRDMALFAGGDLFKRKYKLVTKKESKSGNSWFEVSVKPAGMPLPEEFTQAEALYNRFAQVNIEFETHNDEAEQVSEY